MWNSVEDNLRFFRELLTVNSCLYSWTYDKYANVLFTNSPLKGINEIFFPKDTGFSGESYFCEQFKKVIGETPLQYRTAGK